MLFWTSDTSAGYNPLASMIHSQPAPRGGLRENRTVAETRPPRPVAARRAIREGPAVAGGERAGRPRGGRGGCHAGERRPAAGAALPGGLIAGASGGRAGGAAGPGESLGTDGAPPAGGAARGPPRSVGRAPLGT